MSAAGLWGRSAQVRAGDWTRGRVGRGGRGPGLAAVALLLSLAPPGQAQQPAPASLTLEEALDRAALHNPAVRQARNRVGLAGSLRKQAWGGFLPSLSLSLSTGQGFRREETAFDFFGNPIENPEVRTVYNSSTSNQATVRLPLFEGGRRFHELARVSAQEEVERAGAAAALNAALASVVRQFLEARRQGEFLEIEEDLLEGRERDLEATRRLFTLASRSRSDVLGAELEVERQRLQASTVRGALSKARLALRTALGDPDLAQVDPADPGIEVYDPARLDPDSLVALALSSNPQLLRESAAVREQGARARVARAGRWPSISLSGSLYRQAFGRDQDALFVLQPRDLGGGLSLGIQVPLFQQFQLSYQVAEADVGVRNAGETLRGARLQVEEAVRARYVDLQTAYLGAIQADRARSIAEERLRIVREEYRLATRTFEELQEAVRSAGDARRQATQARYDFALASLALDEATGLGIPGS